MTAEGLQHFEAIYEEQTVEFDAVTWPAALNEAIANQSAATGDLLEIRWLWATVTDDASA